MAWIANPGTPGAGDTMEKVIIAPIKKAIESVLVMPELPHITRRILPATLPPDKVLGGCPGGYCPNTVPQTFNVGVATAVGGPKTLGTVGAREPFTPRVAVLSVTGARAREPDRIPYIPDVTKWELPGFLKTPFEIMRAGQMALLPGVTPRVPEAVKDVLPDVPNLIPDFIDDFDFKLPGIPDFPAFPKIPDVTEPFRDLGGYMSKMTMIAIAGIILIILAKKWK